MGVPSFSSFKVQPGTEPLPPRSQEGPFLKYNIGLTVAETTAVAFIYETISKALTGNVGLVVVGTHEDMQEVFANYQEKTFKKLSPEDRGNLAPLVRSIWEKTRAYLDTFFTDEKYSAVREDFAQECQEAERWAKQILEKGSRCEVLTRRQALLLKDMFTAVESMPIELKANVTIGDQQLPVRIISNGQIQYNLSFSMDEKCAIDFSYHILANLEGSATHVITRPANIAKFDAYRAEKNALIPESAKKTYPELLKSIRAKTRELINAAFADMEAEMTEKILVNDYRRECEAAEKAEQFAINNGRPGVIFCATERSGLVSLFDLTTL